jgi:hypothetical protein
MSKKYRFRSDRTVVADLGFALVMRCTPIRRERLRLSVTDRSPGGPCGDDKPYLICRVPDIAILGNRQAPVSIAMINHTRREPRTFTQAEREARKASQRKKLRKR